MNQENLEPDIVALTGLVHPQHVRERGSSPESSGRSTGDQVSRLPDRCETIGIGTLRERRTDRRAVRINRAGHFRTMQHMTGWANAIGGYPLPKDSRSQRFQSGPDE